jgi:hypothetical protein
VRNLLNTVELANLVKGVDGWRETSVKTKDLSLNNSSQGKVVEKLSESFPHIRISVLSQTLIIEAVPNEKIMLRRRRRSILTLV